MNYFELLLCITTLFVASSVSLPSEKKPSDVNLSKRNLEELSYSYAATDIGSKSGTRIKTITVIKNIANKKHGILKINPESHKNEDWGSEFRDNFDKIGKIPELPDVFSKEKEESEQQPESQEEAKVDAMTKDSIPIYEEPEPDTSLKAEDSSEEAKGEEASEKLTKSSRVISKLPKDIELIEIGPISLKQAEQSAKSQALHFKTLRSEEEELKEYVQHSPTHEFTRPVKPLLSKSKIFDQLELNTSEEKPRGSNPKHYTTAESNAQTIYAKYPAIKYTNLQQFSTTTVANPYIAPNKKSQVFKRFGNLQNQKTPVTSDRYIAPSVRNAYTTIKPVTLPLASIPYTITKNPKQLRFRGVRY